MVRRPPVLHMLLVVQQWILSVILRYPITKVDAQLCELFPGVM